MYKRNKKPCFDDSSRAQQDTRIPKMFWVIIFMTEQLLIAHALYVHVEGSMGDQSTVSNMSYFCSPHRVASPAILLRRIELRTSRLTAQQLHPPNHCGCDISVQMCLYIPLNMWKCHRNRNLKFQKIDPSWIRTQVIRVIACTPTTKLMVEYQEHQIWTYKLDLTSSCQSSVGISWPDSGFSLITNP